MVPIEVIAEVVYVLKGVYSVDGNKIRDALMEFLSEVTVAEKEVIQVGLDAYVENNLDFVDCILYAYSCVKKYDCNGVQREHNKKLNNGLPILHKVPPKRDYGRYFCIMAEKGGTSHGGLTEKLSPFFHAKKQEVNAYGR